MKTTRTLLHIAVVLFLATSCSKQGEVLSPAASDPSTTCRDHCPTGDQGGPSATDQAKDL